MRTFIFTIFPSSNKRGYNRTITVYEVKDNYPELVDYNDRINTASYHGDSSEAWRIIASNDPLIKLRDGYRPESDDVQLVEV